MTEDEAKTKWCFHFIASHTDPRAQQSQYGIERGEPGPFVHHCLGSACMAWRWLPSTSLARARANLAEGRKIDAIKALREAFPSYGLLEAKQVIDGDRPWPNDDAKGYCGLAGAPQ